MGRIMSRTKLRGAYITFSFFKSCIHVLMHSFHKKILNIGKRMMFISDFCLVLWLNLDFSSNAFFYFLLKRKSIILSENFFFFCAIYLNFSQDKMYASELSCCLASDFIYIYYVLQSIHDNIQHSFYHFYFLLPWEESII